MTVVLDTIIRTEECVKLCLTHSSVLIVSEICCLHTGFAQLTGFAYFLRKMTYLYSLPHPLPSVFVTLFYLLYVPVTTSCLHNAGTRDSLHRNLKCRNTTQVITVLNWPNILRTANSFGGVYTTS
jgi:hypothetical protein